jgi:hypothetical protein
MARFEPAPSSPEDFMAYLSPCKGSIAISLLLLFTAASFTPGSARTLEVKLEAFNVPNRPNFAFTGVAADGSPVIAPTWGRMTSTVTNSRQIQVGAKLTF